MFATPAFLYDSRFIETHTSLKDAPKNWTTADNFKNITISPDKEVYSDQVDSYASDNVLTISGLRLGLYLLKAVYYDSNGSELEVYRDTLHLVQDNQWVRMLIDR